MFWGAEKAKAHERLIISCLKSLRKSTDVRTTRKAQSAYGHLLHLENGGKSSCWATVDRHKRRIMPVKSRLKRGQRRKDRVFETEKGKSQDQPEIYQGQHKERLLERTIRGELNRRAKANRSCLAICSGPRHHSIPGDPSPQTRVVSIFDITGEEPSHQI